nr:MAG TPA: hypothetical protein [Bacteriophage sp.]
MYFLLQYFQLVLTLFLVQHFLPLSSFYLLHKQN